MGKRVLNITLSNKLKLIQIRGIIRNIAIKYMKSPYISVARKLPHYLFKNNKNKQFDYIYDGFVLFGHKYKKKNISFEFKYKKRPSKSLKNFLLC